MFKRIVSAIVCLCFILTNLQGSYALETGLLPGGQPGLKAISTLNLPEPGSMVGSSAAFTPLALKGLVVNPKKPLEFQFLVDTGKSGLSAETHSNASLQEESTKLIKYFLAGLTIPEGDLWVNLSPYEKDRITTASLGQTDLGRDLLAQDYILKQLTASLIYPEKDLGKQFWSRIYSQAQEKFGTTNVPVNTFNKVWILPDQAQVFENKGAAYVTKATLKVMLDEDYTAKFKHSKARPPTMFDPSKESQKQANSSQIIREIVLPAIEKEVNEGQNFAPLRQIYTAMILAKWYKETVANGLLDALYTNKSKIKGVNLADPSIKQQIYERYLQAYKKGVFNYIKEEPGSNGQAQPRKYFSGGMQLMPKGLAKDGAMSAIKSDGAMVSFQVRLDSVIPVKEVPQVLDEAMTNNSKDEKLYLGASVLQHSGNTTDVRWEISAKEFPFIDAFYFLQSSAIPIVNKESPEVVELGSKLVSLFPDSEGNMRMLNLEALRAFTRETKPKIQIGDFIYQVENQGVRIIKNDASEEFFSKDQELYSFLEWRIHSYLTVILVRAAHAIYDQEKTFEWDDLASIFNNPNVTDFSFSKEFMLWRAAGGIIGKINKKTGQSKMFRFEIEQKMVPQFEVQLRWQAKFALAVARQVLKGNNSAPVLALPSDRELLDYDDILPVDVKENKSDSAMAGVEDVHDIDRWFDLVIKDREALPAVLDWEPRSVYVIGSARPEPGTPTYERAKDFGRVLGGKGIHTRTGASNGVMQGASQGAALNGLKVQGVRLIIPKEANVHEQSTNPYVSEDRLIGAATTPIRQQATYTNIIGAAIFPGGIGSFEEWFSVEYLGIPAVYLDRNFYEPIRQVLFDLWRKFDLPVPNDWFIFDDTQEAADKLDELTANHTKSSLPALTREDISRSNAELAVNFETIKGWSDAVVFAGESKNAKHLQIARELAKNTQVRTISQGPLLDALMESVGAEKLQVMLHIPEHQPIPQAALEVKDRIISRDLFNYFALSSLRAKAFVFLPGSVNTFKDLADLLVKIVLKEVPETPIILVGKDFWQPAMDKMTNTMLQHQPPTIYAQYRDLYTIVDSLEEANQAMDAAMLTDGNQELLVRVIRAGHFTRPGPAQGVILQEVAQVVSRPSAVLNKIPDQFSRLLDGKTGDFLSPKKAKESLNPRSKLYQVVFNGQTTAYFVFIDQEDEYDPKRSSATPSTASDTTGTATVATLDKAMASTQRGRNPIDQKTMLDALANMQNRLNLNIEDFHSRHNQNVLENPNQRGIVLWQGEQMIWSEDGDDETGKQRYRAVLHLARAMAKRFFVDVLIDEEYGKMKDMYVVKKIGIIMPQDTRNLVNRLKIFLKEQKKQYSDDQAMLMKEDAKDLGGIDFNATKINRTGSKIQVEFDPAQFNELLQGGFEGFTPVIINMTPIQSVFPLLGIVRQENDALAKM